MNRSLSAVGIAAASVLAVPALVRAADDLPGDLDGWRRRQDGQMRRGDAARAEEEARARVAREPESPEALYLLGRILGLRGMLGEAKVQFQRALEIDRDAVPALLGMATCHLKEREFDAAEREARRAHELAPSAESRRTVVSACWAKGDRPGTYRFLREELAANPADHGLRFLLATLLFQERQLQNAEKELRAVLAAEPGHLVALEMLVRTLEDLGRPDESVAVCRESIRRLPKEPAVRQILAGLFGQREEFEAAAAVVEEILAMDLSPADRERGTRYLSELRAAAERPRTRRPLTAKQILEDVQSPEVEKRRSALRILCEMRPEFVPLPMADSRMGFPREILGLVHDEDEVVRILAARVLARFSREGVAGWLQEALFGTRQPEKSPVVRARLVESLGATGTLAVLPSLVRAMDETDPETVRSAVEAIHGLTGKRFLDDLSAPPAAADLPALRERVLRWWLLEPQGRHWRTKTAEAVGREDQRTLAWDLVPWLLDENAVLRGAVLEAFARLTGDESWRTADGSTPEARAALKERAFEALAETR